MFEKTKINEKEAGDGKINKERIVSSVERDKKVFIGLVDFSPLSYRASPKV